MMIVIATRPTPASARLARLARRESAVSTAPLRLPRPRTSNDERPSLASWKKGRERGDAQPKRNDRPKVSPTPRGATIRLCTDLALLTVTPAARDGQRPPPPSPHSCRPRGLASFA